MAFEIVSLTAAEILDSRSRPTLQVDVRLTGDVVASAGVPSGASTGSREARERRDGDPARFGGAGVLDTIATVEGEIVQAVAGRRWLDQEELDRALRALDGTPDLSRLGANAVVGVSMAVARALAAAKGRRLHESLAGFAAPPRLPVPSFNVINGGAHAPNQLAFQEFMVSPIGAPSMADAVRAGAEVYAGLRGLLAGSGRLSGLGDEGGFAPELADPTEVLELLTRAIADAGYTAGRDGVAIALDPAASGFRAADGRYVVGTAPLTSEGLITYYEELVAAFPIWSIEDGLGEDDLAGWQELTRRLGGRIQLVGDDNFCTNPALIATAIEQGVANAALIKPNQIGTVTDTLEAMRVCHRAGYAQMVSHRSGETTDTFIADLAVASGCGQIKSGAPARGERVAKYNRLLQIGRARPDLTYGLPAGR